MMVIKSKRNAIVFAVTTLVISLNAPAHSAPVNEEMPTVIFSTSKKLCNGLLSADEGARHLVEHAEDHDGQLIVSTLKAHKIDAAAPQFEPIEFVSVSGILHLEKAVFQFENQQPAMLVYRVSGENNYFNGDVIIVTPLEVSSDDVIEFIADGGQVEDMPLKGKARGWTVFEAPGANQQRYTRLYPFIVDSKTYVLAQSNTSNPTFHARLFQPTKEGKFRTVCVFEKAKMDR